MNTLNHRFVFLLFMRAINYDELYSLFKIQYRFIYVYSRWKSDGANSHWELEELKCPQSI
jgi:hypothetical protein